MAPHDQDDDDLEALEIELLLEAVHRHYGFDFRGYALRTLKRRLWRRVYAEGQGTISGLQERVLHDPACMRRLLLDLSINVTAMFRDPAFYRSFREKVVPLLHTYPFVRLWSAGCSSGEEVYSLAILLREEGLHERTRIYATDMNESVLEQARAGTFPLSRMRDYTENYQRAGGTQAFVSYYSTSGEVARFHPALTENVVFAQHNLVSDSSFNEFNAIVCRNVLIYFRRAHHDRVYSLFRRSLDHLGVLALGREDSMRGTANEPCFKTLDPDEKIFQRVR